MKKSLFFILCLLMINHSGWATSKISSTQSYTISQETKKKVIIATSIATLFFVPICIYFYRNHQWHGAIDNILLEKLARKFEVDLTAEDQDAYRDYRTKNGIDPERKLDIELIKLAAMGNDEALKRIRALTRPQAAKAAYFIAYKRGHFAFAERLRKALRHEYLFEEDFKPSFI